MWCINVTNPSLDDILYMKNWYINNECFQVFCNQQKKQLAILHSRECEDIKPCPEALPNARSGM